MRFVRHPFFGRDLIGIVDHIIEITQGDTGAALRRLDEVDALLRSIADNPTSGTRLEGRLEGWLVRHGGSGHRLTIVLRPDVEVSQIYLALVAFGGRDWMRLASTRHMFPDF